MRYDMHPSLGHPEVAGWALGALDRPESEAFGEHLRSCARCQAAVTEFESVATALRRPVPADEPPVGLKERVLAAVHAGVGQAAEIPAAEQTWHAVEAWQIIQDPRREEAPRLEQAPRLDHARPRENVVREAARRWRRRNRRRVAVTAAVAAAVAVVVILIVLALSGG